MALPRVHGRQMARSRALLLSLLLGACAAMALAPLVAHAQVARPLSGGSAGAAAAAPTAPVPIAWSPSPPTPEDVRGLPPCPPGAPMPASGELYTCRPRFDAFPFHGMFTVELGPAWVDARAPVLGSGFQFASGLDVGLSRAFALGARYAYLSGGDAGFDGDDDGVDDENTTNLGVHLVGGGPRLRLFTDETARESWSLEVDGGYAYSWNDVAGSGAFVRVGVGRNIGAFLAPDAVGQIGLQLNYYQGVGAASELRALTFGVRLSPEWGVPEPKNIDTRPELAGFAYTFGLRWALFAVSLDGESGFGLASGLFGLTFGLPLNRWFEPRMQADLSYIGLGGENGPDAPLHTTGLAGVRLRGNGFVPMYLEAMGGWTHRVGTAPLDYRSGAVVDVGLGLNFTGCAGGFQFGVHYRFGVLARNDRYYALMFVIGGEYGSERGALAGEAPPPRRSPPSAYRCGSEYTPGRVDRPPELPPPPPPPPLPPPPPTGDGSLDLGGRVDVTVPEVRLDVRVEPVTVELTLGLALFGGAVRMNIDVRSLPLAQIRDSGFVTVQVIGPPAALARAEAELRAALGPDGARVSGFASVALPDRMDVRAIFTIWPPGTRPPGR